MNKRSQKKGNTLMRIGIVGLHYGHIGGILESTLSAPDAELVGVVEADDSLCERFIGTLSIPRFKSIDELLTSARPELVVEGLRHDGKAELVEKCASAGAHVLLDKPLCRSLEDWTRMRDAVRTHGIQLSMWFTSRSYPPFIALRQIIESGELGELVSLISTHPHKLQRETATPWYFDDEIYTGTFHDLAGHGIDQVRWLTGAEFKGVHAQWTCKRFTDTPQLIDHAQASFSLDDGSLATLTADWLTPQASPSFGDTRFIIMGTRGSAHLRAYAQDHLYVVSEAKGAYEALLPSARGSVFVQELITAIEHGQSPFINTRDVFATAYAGLQAQESAKLGGQFITLDDMGL
jgi:predicted dehydrogenase